MRERLILVGMSLKGKGRKILGCLSKEEMNWLKSVNSMRQKALDFGSDIVGNEQRQRDARS